MSLIKNHGGFILALVFLFILLGVIPVVVGYGTPVFGLALAFIVAAFFFLTIYNRRCALFPYNFFYHIQTICCLILPAAIFVGSYFVYTPTLQNYGDKELLIYNSSSKSIRYEKPRMMLFNPFVERPFFVEKNRERSISVKTANNKSAKLSVTVEYDYKLLAENIAKGFKTRQEVKDWLNNSASYKAKVVGYVYEVVGDDPVRFQEEIKFLSSSWLKITSVKVELVHSNIIF